jgi:SRSO17 transposase
LGRDRWDADALRDLVRDYATEHLADENAVLVIDEIGFLKQGKALPMTARRTASSDIAAGAATRTRPAGGYTPRCRFFIALRTT